MNVDTLINIVLIACVWITPLLLIGLLVIKGSRRARAMDTDATP
jgi:hypothetical protein